MKIGSGSTVRSGNRSASVAQCRQCVVTLRPVSSPASAKANAPVHTDAICPARPALRRSQSISSGSQSRAPSPPGTSSRSGGSACRRSRSGTIRAIAGGQRGYYNGSIGGCTKVSTTTVTILAGPLNYFGVNPKVDCTLPHPSK
jgi:hypothetical protein